MQASLPSSGRGPLWDDADVRALVPERAKTPIQRHREEAAAHRRLRELAAAAREGRARGELAALGLAALPEESAFRRDMERRRGDADSPIRGSEGGTDEAADRGTEDRAHVDGERR